MILDYRKVESILKEKHVTKRKIAQLLGMQENTVTAAFRNNSKRTFSDQNILDIAKFLDVPFYEIITQPDPFKGESLQNHGPVLHSLSGEAQEKFIDEGLTIALAVDDTLFKKYGIRLIPEEDETAIMNDEYNTNTVLRIIPRLQLQALIGMFLSLNQEGQAAALQQIEKLTSNPAYKKIELSKEGHTEEGGKE